MTDPTANGPTVGIVGYGEVGSAFAERFRDAGVDVVVLNRSPDALRDRLAGTSIAVADGPIALASETDLVLSCVWPATAVEAAERVAPGLADGQPFLDLNSVGPTTVERVVDVVVDAGGAPLKATIMGSVGARGADVRIPVAGPGRQGTIALLRESGFTVDDAGEDPVTPAAIKTFRSLFTKGLRQLAAETLVPAAAYGVREDVLDDLSGLFDDRPVDEWLRDGLENTPRHAARRLGELAEVSEAVDAAGYRAPTLDATIDLHRHLRDAPPGRSPGDPDEPGDSSDSGAPDEAREADYVAVLEALDPHLAVERESTVDGEHPVDR
ncbi:DUF1932 domain-containing protein [Halorubrum sp. JWXQ-INN 858]|uniref:NAD(P)-dependent oxidoreductase n=1 Tax=Halorubrum sp. JWXQ-INN 858 TaxID=2690782 RepID=UPI00135CAD5B|nr:NAD(P)-binding domain-containing protein [Halorubrum sp. JWXQ-INN 858]MWV64563.1 DUF1932 domain-containing protein [Halorubrum sp. JWXQ-INN 858]